MRHLAITLATAALVVAVFLSARALRSGPGEISEPADARPEAAESRPPASRPADAAAQMGIGGVTVVGVPELEALHRQHGAVGDAMRKFLAYTIGNQWNLVDRARMQEVLHALRYATTEADIPYLLDLFERTKDPAFRWWYSWLVPQLAEEMRERFPAERFVDAMTEVYRLDPARGYVALTHLNKPVATERYFKLLDAETDPQMRLHAIAYVAHSDWPHKEESLARFARDEARAPVERMEALGALGRVGVSEGTLELAMDVALGPPKPLSGLTGSLAASHAVHDVRSAAILAVMQRGDQESARRLFEAADAAGIDSDLAKMVDQHIGGFRGPDVSELIYQRAQRRQYVSAGEVTHLVRDLDRLDRARLRDLLPFIRDAEAKKLVEKVVEAR
jgi:hypothetical protein